MVQFECLQDRIDIILEAFSYEGEPIPLTRLKIFVKISSILHIFSSFLVKVLQVSASRLRVLSYEYFNRLLSEITYTVQELSFLERVSVLSKRHLPKIRIIYGTFFYLYLYYHLSSIWFLSEFKSHNFDVSFTVKLSVISTSDNFMFKFMLNIISEITFIYFLSDFYLCSPLVSLSKRLECFNLNISGEKCLHFSSFLFYATLLELPLIAYQVHFIF